MAAELRRAISGFRSRGPRVGLLLIAGGGIGVICNEWVPQERHVRYLMFSKTALLEKALPSSVAEVSTPHAEPPATVQADPKLEVAIFLSSECEECAFIRSKVLPEIQKLFGNVVAIRGYDTGRMAHYKKLVEYEQRYGSDEDVTAKLFVADRYLAGAAEIAAKGIRVIKEVLDKRRTRPNHDTEHCTHTTNAGLGLLGPREHPAMGRASRSGGIAGSVPLGRHPKAA